MDQDNTFKEKLYLILAGIFISSLVTCNLISNKFVTVDFSFKNVIEDKYGTTKLYKSKKRMELRFYKNILDCHNTIEVYNLNQHLASYFVFYQI